MPNIPIPLVGGQNVDQTFNDVVVGSEAVNMTPEQTAGGMILRNTPGFAADQAYTTTGSDILLGTLSVNGLVYVVRQNGSDGELYEIEPVSETITFRGTMTGMSVAARMASNGVNIVIVNMLSVQAGAPDYVFDIATTTLSTITSGDADYGTLGSAIDVVFYQGYYFFINTRIIFHGDLKTDAGEGVAFNLLSFGTLPFINNEGKGVEEVGGQVYVFGITSTVIYNLVGTTPFVLQQQVGSDIDVGIANANTKTKVKDTVYLYGQQANEQLDFYKLVGLNFVRIANNSQVKTNLFLTTGVTQGVMNSYVSRGNTIVWWRESQGADTYAYNDTISDATGVKSWYLVGGYNESTDREHVSRFAGTMPVLATIGTSTIGAPSTRDSRLFFVHADFGVTDLYLSLYDENFTEISQDVISSAGNPQVTKFTFTFDYIRQGAEPIFISKIRFKLIDSGMTAELQFSDGTNNKTGSISDNFPYTSLGELTPTADGVVEWRRIGRIHNQRSFRLILSNPNNEGLFASVSGGIISGELTV